jgi:hypothetical protein
MQGTAWRSRESYDGVSELRPGLELPDGPRAITGLPTSLPHIPPYPVHFGRATTALSKWTSHFARAAAAPSAYVIHVARARTALSK